MKTTTELQSELEKATKELEAAKVRIAEVNKELEASKAPVVDLDIPGVYLGRYSNTDDRLLIVFGKDQILVMGKGMYGQPFLTFEERNSKPVLENKSYCVGLYSNIHLVGLDSNKSTSDNSRLLTETFKSVLKL